MARCPNRLCRSEDMLTDEYGGEVFCGACGTVVSQSMSDAASEGFRTDGDTGTHGGGFTTDTMYDRGVSTQIGDRDSSGRRVSLGSSLRRMRSLDTSAKGSSASVRVLTGMAAICDRMGVPNVVHERAAAIYRLSREGRVLTGRDTGGTAAACVYVACRECGVTRTMDDFTRGTGISRKTLSRGVRSILWLLGKPIEQHGLPALIGRLAASLCLDGRLEREAASLADENSGNPLLHGKSPMSMAAAFVFVSMARGGVPVSYRMVARASNLTDITVRNRVKNLVDIGLDFPRDHAR